MSKKPIAISVAHAVENAIAMIIGAVPSVYPRKGTPARARAMLVNGYCPTKGKIRMPLTVKIGYSRTKVSAWSKRLPLLTVPMMRGSPPINRVTEYVSIATEMEPTEAMIPPKMGPYVKVATTVSNGGTAGITMASSPARKSAIKNQNPTGKPSSAAWA